MMGSPHNDGGAIYSARTMNQMQRTFGLILILFFLVDSQQIIRKKIGCDA